MFWFQLGREHKLSIVELLAIFSDGKIVFHNTEILILDNLQEKQVLSQAKKLWGTIKIIKISTDNIQDLILNLAKKSEGKFKYGLSNFLKQKKSQKRTK